MAIIQRCGLILGVELYYKASGCRPSIMFFFLLGNLTVVPSTPPGGEGGYYTKLYPTNLVHCVIESEASDLEGDGTEKTTPTITPMTSLDTTGM